MIPDAASSIPEDRIDHPTVPAIEDQDPIWLNGSLVPAGSALISPLDRGLLLADGLFETMWARGGRIIRLPRHAARLAAGARALGLSEPPDVAELAGAADTLLAALALDGPGVDAVLRLTLTRGPGGRGLDPPVAEPGQAPPAPTLLLTASPLAVAPGEHPSATAIVSRHGVAPGPLSRHKTLAYTAAVIARREARAVGADLALRPNPAGRLAGADAANLWLLRGDRLRTPPLSEGALAGTVRAALLALAESVGLRPEVKPISPADLPAGDAVLVSSAVVGLREVVAVDGEPVGRRTPAVLARITALRAALAADDCDCPPDAPTRAGR